MCRLLRRGARYGHKGEYVASGVMARSWPLRLRSLHADPCAGKRVMIERKVLGKSSQRALAFASLHGLNGDHLSIGG